MTFNVVPDFSNQWSDLCDIDIVPLMTDEQVGQVLAG
jgi:hypothetical protein